MLDFSVFIPETHRDISPGYVETLIQARREDLFTGLMRLSYPSGENLIFTFLEGVPRKFYRCLEHSVDIISRQSWSDVLDHAGATAGFLRLPLEAIRFLHVACEAPLVQVEKSTLPLEGLREIARKWSIGQDPCIVHMQSAVINKYCLIAGHSTPIVEELSFAAGGAQFSIADTTFSQALPTTNYLVTRYVSNGEHDVWRQYELRLAFGPLMRMLLNRFSELAGRALTERLCERLSDWIREGGWHVGINGNGIVNRHYFDTLEDAIKFYVDLLRRFQAEAAPAVGARMLDGIQRDVLNKSDPYRRELLIQHIYSQSGVGGITVA